MRKNALQIVSLLLLAFVWQVQKAEAQNYVVGEQGFILKTNDLGKTWQVNNDSTSNADLEGIRVVNRDTVFVAGRDNIGNGNGQMYRTINGKTFSKVTGRYSAHFRDVSIFRNGRGVVINK